MQDFQNQPDTTSDGRFIRRVRSFVLREGRLTKGQQSALDRLWPVYGLEQKSGLIDPATLFGRPAPLILEIGYGMGSSLIEMAQAAPHQDFIGIEVHRPGVGALLMGIEEQQITNLRTYCDDAVDILQHCIPDNSLDRLQLFFPDPWHKKKHHKRRIVQTTWLNLVASKLKVGGQLHLATDWQNYAEHMSELCLIHPQFNNLGDEQGFCPRPSWRPETKFERRGINLGHGVWDLLFERTP